MHSLILRPANTQDSEAISTLIATIQPSYHTIFTCLNQTHTQSLSIVAEVNYEIVGYIEFVPITIGQEKKLITSWHYLSFLGINDIIASQDVRGFLIQSGLAGLRKKNASGCITLGTTSEYQPYGFTEQHHLTFSHQSTYPILATTLTTAVFPKGIVHFPSECVTLALS